MDNQELKPTLSLPYVPVQQSGDVHMNCGHEEQTGGIHRALNDNSMQSQVQVSSPHQGNRMPDGNHVVASSVQNPRDLIDSTDSSLRNAKDGPRNGKGAREAPPVRNFTSGGSSSRAPKRKKDSVVGSPSPLGRPRETAFTPVRPMAERGNLTSSPPSSPQHVSIHTLSQARPSRHQNSCTPPQGSQVSFSRISSDNSPSANILDGRQSASTHENHLHAQRSGQFGGNQVADFDARRAKVREWGNRSLCVVDPVLWDVMEREKVRQYRGIELIASENFTSQAVIEALGSHLTNKYSEGLPGSRYYGGNEYIDMIESLCIGRALAAFHLDPKEWGVNVQPYSCTSANFAVYTALLQPKDRIMGLDVPSGGHVSHGYYTASGKKVSGASIFFESLPFKVNPQNGLIDFDTLEKFALNYRPKILICGGSAYPREWDYARFRDIANKCGATLMCDMAHISGLIAAKECASPFEHCDIVTSTTHKSLRGPRGGVIFYRKGLKLRRNGADLMYDFEDKINFAVHPSLQGGPHNNHIAALAVAFKQVNTPEYQQYIRQVKKNAQALASALIKRGCVLVTGGTDNHLLLWDLRNRGLTGNRLEKVCEICHLTLNKNAVFGDSNALGVGGVRIGTPAMTSRGCIEADFEVIADFLMRAVQIAESVQSEHGKLQKDFVKGLQNNRDVIELRNNVERFASMFEMPGFEIAGKNFN